MIRQPQEEILGWTVMRGVAALWVLLYHYAKHFAPEDQQPQLIGIGYLAVDFFFVLSGAVMFLVYAEQKRLGQFSSEEFLVKRVARLYPVHLVTMLAAIVIVVVGDRLGLKPLEAALVPHFLANATMLHAWGVTDRLWLNNPSWSISAEFFAYLLFPILVVVVLRLPRWAAVASVVSVFAFGIMMAEAISGPKPARNLFQLTHDFGILRILPSFVLGMFLIKFLNEIVREPGGSGTRRAGAALGVLGFSAMILAAANEAHLGFVLASAILIGALYLWRPHCPAVLVWLGTISFSLYMTHALVQIVGFRVISELFGYPDHGVALIWLPVMTVVAVGVADATWRLLEVPGRRILLAKWKAARRPDAMDSRMQTGDGG